ncbi:hypothetical protein SAMN05443667_11176 [Flavobacterium gillisiae]|uniref:Uncharacterized protein n=1 Tax=Flavobacterium gillisiae TaxID=150146 RepID=A0A1H4F0Q5_9FLAO|nr:hypothetical protein [Flavobacterium gillisiae]SEA90092.1 hypothetical protein SAMN05443667_11176 [Flavobacterium gillisiae]
MKKIILLGFLIISFYVHSQNNKLNEVNVNVSKIEKLKQKNKLDLVEINDTKTCGGNTVGYFHLNNLSQLALGSSNYSGACLRRVPT